MAWMLAGAGPEKTKRKGRKKKISGIVLVIKQSSVGPEKKKFMTKFGDWSFSARDRTLKLTAGFPTNSLVQSGCEARGRGERGATGCTWTRVPASAAWRALKGASQAVCGPRGRSVVSAGSLPGVGSCCSASMSRRGGWGLIP